MMLPTTLLLLHHLNIMGDIVLPVYVICASRKEIKSKEALAISTCFTMYLCTMRITIE